MKLSIAVAALVTGCIGVLAAPIVVFAAVVGAAPGLGLGMASLTAAIPPTGVADIPAAAFSDYVSAAGQCPRLAWSVLAGIGKVESDHGRSDLPGVHRGANAAGAEGPMQFLPATFAAYALATGSSAPSPYDLSDAAVAAARMLCANGGGAAATLSNAVWDYNHNAAYVASVLSWAAVYTAAYDAAAGVGAVAATWAVGQVGRPYRWGAAGPAEYDCSGLAMRAWQAAGVTLPRIAADQYGAGVHVLLSQAEAGDLVFFAPDPADPATIDHVGIYLGDGMMVDAPHTGTVVRIEPVWASGRVPDVTRP